MAEFASGAAGGRAAAGEATDGERVPGTLLTSPSPRAPGGSVCPEDCALSRKSSGLSSRVRARGGAHGGPGADDKPSHDCGPDPPNEPSCMMQVILCCVSMLEGADTQLLGAAMKALQQDIGMALSDISYMTISQMVSTNLAAPFWGILADRGILKRRTILLVGALGQGLVTIALAFIDDILPMVFLRALNGILLAALRPISNGIVADTTAESHRGKIFGRVQSALLMGMFVTTLCVVPMATEQVMGFQGWRVAFVLVGLVSVVVSVMVALLMEEPQRQEITSEAETSSSGRGGCHAVVDEVTSLLQFFKMPTFCVMIMQGIFGTIPWSVMGYMTLYFQLIGIENKQVAVLSSVGPICGAFGNVLGGLVADTLARKFHLHGRPLSAQITVAMGIPIIFMIFHGIPVERGSFWVYFVLNVAFGVLGSWAQSGTNFPILSHIVPSSARSRVMAWECALENSIANAVGPMVVSLLAERAFGYNFGDGNTGDQDWDSAKALGKAMTATICIPWAICFLAYTLLHWTYPRDVRRMEQKMREQDERCKTQVDPQVVGSLAQEDGPAFGA